MTDYYMKMTLLLREINLSIKEEWECPRDNVCYPKRLENEEVLDFLVGLNKELDDIRGIVFSLRTLPLVLKVLFEIRRTNHHG